MKQVYTPFMMNTPAKPAPVYDLKWARQVARDAGKKAGIQLQQLLIAERILFQHLQDREGGKRKMQERKALHAKTKRMIRTLAREAEAYLQRRQQEQLKILSLKERRKR